MSTLYREYAYDTGVMVTYFTIIVDSFLLRDTVSGQGLLKEKQAFQEIEAMF